MSSYPEKFTMWCALSKWAYWTSLFGGCYKKPTVLWSPCSLCMNLCDYLLWGYLRECVYRTSLQELQAEVEAVAEEMTGDRLHETVDTCVVP